MRCRFWPDYPPGRGLPSLALTAWGHAASVGRTRQSGIYQPEEDESILDRPDQGGEVSYGVAGGIKNVHASVTEVIDTAAIGDHEVLLKGDLADLAPANASLYIGEGAALGYLGTNEAKNPGPTMRSIAGGTCSGRPYDRNGDD